MKIKLISTIIVLLFGITILANTLWSEETQKAIPPITPTENTKTIIEIQKLTTKKPSGTLGTTGYQSLSKEKSFFKKLDKDEITTGSIDVGIDYNILGKVKKYVSWFGIVRKINISKDKKPHTLLVENKYFDGMTDSHILALSYNGGGDFIVEVTDPVDDIEDLSLIRAYGKVVKEEKNIPTLRAEYIRCFPWGEFTFMEAYGKQKGNTEWKKGIVVKSMFDEPYGEGNIYNPYPDNAYYERLLGEHKQDGNNLKLSIPDTKVTPELKATIEELIKQLTHDDWETRKQAQEELIEIGTPCLGILSKAVNETEDPEIKYRGNLIIKKILNK